MRKTLKWLGYVLAGLLGIAVFASAAGDLLWSTAIHSYCLQHAFFFMRKCSLANLA
jgi:hypothetical protein